MDKRGPPNQPHIHLTSGHLRLEEQKRCYDITLSSQEVLHAPSECLKPSWSCRWRYKMSFSVIANCPLGKVLTYKNLIYLFNLQFCLFAY